MSFIAIALFVIVALTVVVGISDLVRDLRADNTPCEFYRLTTLSEFFEDQVFSDNLLDELYWEQEYYPPINWDEFFPMKKTQAEVHVDLKTVFSNHRTVCRSMHRRELRI
jgi:hypothetical protein